MLRRNGPDSPAHLDAHRASRWAVSQPAMIVAVCLAASLLAAAAAPAAAAPRSLATALLRHKPSADVGAITVGTCHDGSLPGGVELPARTPTLQRLSAVKERGTGFATPRLVAFVLRTADRLAAVEGHAGVPLRVGNLSLQGGGDMRWSHSHAAGRDVDFPLYVVDMHGRSVDVDGFVHFDDDGLGRHKRRKLRFDVGRNWNLIATLLTDPGVDVAHLYLAEPLRALVLAHAARAGVEAPLIRRAELVLAEPSHAGRHDDHLHVRIFCDADEIRGGCVDEDARWPWSTDTSLAVRDRVDAAARELTSRSRRKRLAALATLRPWLPYDDEACRAVAWAAGYDGSAAVRERALSHFDGVAAPCATAQLLGAARATTSQRELEALVRAAVRLADADDRALLRELMVARPEGFRAAWTTSMRSEIRATIARRLALVADPAAVTALRAALDDPEAPTRRAVRHAVEVLANRRLADADAASRWLRDHRHVQPLRWLAEGFALLGLPIEATAAELAPRLVEVLRREDPFIGRNAERLLEHLAGGVRLDHLDTPRHRHRAWARYWSLHGVQFGDRRLELDAIADAGDGDIDDDSDDVDGSGGDRRAVLGARDGF